MPADLQAKTFFLTYPQTSFNFDNDYHQYLEFLQRIGSTSFTCIGIEKHADGTPHFHVLVDYCSKQRITKRSFDWKDRHPNIKCVGKTKADYNRVLSYVRKEKEFKEEGCPKFTSKESVWSKVANAKDEGEALSIIKREQPRDFILNRRNIDYSLSKLFATPETSPYSGRKYEEFLIHEELEEWRSEAFL